MLASVSRVDPDERIPRELLINALAESGVTGAALARRLAMDPGTVSDWKTGRIPIAPSRWKAICAAIREVKPSWNPPVWNYGDPPPAITKKNPDA